MKDKYRLVFLDPVTGCAVPSGPGGDGYQLTLPSSWLIEHRKAIADGIKVCKVAVAMGRAVGLPLPGTSALPSEVVSKKELEAVDAVNTLMGEWNAVATGKAVATGQAYKMLRKVLDVQCNDKYLGHCRLHARGGGRCSEQFKTLLNRKITHSALNKSCFTNDSESIEHPSVNHEKFGRYGTSGTCRGGGISSVKVQRAEIAPKSAAEAACHPENTWGPSIDRSRATCGPKRSLSSLGTT